MSTILTRGIVFAKKPRGESDREYLIYSRELGKISAIAKGAQKPVSKLAGHLEPFGVKRIMIADGERFWRIAAAVSEGGEKTPNGDFFSPIAAGCYFAALDSLCRPDFPDEEVFDLSADFLAKLATGRTIREKMSSLNRALFDLLSRLGYCPLIRAKTQKDLFGELGELTQFVAEKRIAAFDFLAKITA